MFIRQERIHPEERTRKCVQNSLGDATIHTLLFNSLSTTSRAVSGERMECLRYIRMDKAIPLTSLTDKQKRGGVIFTSQFRNREGFQSYGNLCKSLIKA